MLPNRGVLLLSLLLACRPERAPAEASRVAVKVSPGSALIIEKRAAISRFLEFEQIPFDDVWIPPASAVAFLDAAVLRFLDTRPPSPVELGVGVSIAREDLGSHVRECAGLLVGDRRQIICQFVLRHPAAGRAFTTEDRSFSIIADGGCEVFLVVADVERREVLSLGCNGVA